ncbi:hypothetical protein E3N88_38979 [Mikania micrantha]|uniref:Integrase catalytic domain-containing protein n=1 Tax=Mikania micrantha TaxID=192012 RepID=A0A5N6LY24_9ASTR|nr:hypothetical protein E3N88_38979 [Mikania micrantha]
MALLPHSSPLYYSHRPKEFEAPPHAEGHHPLQHKWLAKLMGYDYTIEYKQGRENVAADALSRVQGATLFTTFVSHIEPLLLQQVIESQHHDELVQAMINKLKKGEPLPKLHWNGKGALGGYSHGPTDQGDVLLEGYHKEVRETVKKCDVCSRAKHENIAASGLLQPLPIPDAIFSDISMDIIGGLPKVKRKDTIFLVVDRLSKYSHFMVLGHPFSARDVAQVFVDNIYRLPGCPASIISDRDPIFLSSFWKEFLSLQGVESKLSTAYHPQTDDQTEVANRCLECYLRCMVMDRPHMWVKWVSLAEWWYNTTFHSSLGMTPFEALYGFPPPLHIPYLPKDSGDKEVDEVMKDREAATAVLKQSLLQAQNRMKQQADKRRTDREYEKGMWVYLKLQPYMQSSLRVHKHSKLTPKYFGPFLIIDKVGKVAYKFDLPDESQIHPVFHVSLLKPAVGPPDKIIPLTEDVHFRLKPLRVLDWELVKRGSRAAMKVLVHWEGQSQQEATWEFLDDMKLRFPDLAEWVGGSF